MHCLLKCGGGHTGPLAWKEETETAVGGVGDGDGQQVVGAHVMILKYQTYFLWETTTTADGRTYDSPIHPSSSSSCGDGDTHSSMAGPDCASEVRKSHATMATIWRWNHVKGAIK